MNLLEQLSHPCKVLRLVSKNFKALRWKIYLRFKGVIAGSNIKIHGKPIILRLSGTIQIGDNVTLLSDHHRRYHSSIYSPTRLMTDTNENASIEIGNNTRINGASIHATQKIYIGRNCLIAANVTILDSDGHGVLPLERDLSNPISRPVCIEDNVWIGINSIILKGVHIGKNSIIGAGSVVSKSIPPNSIAAGNPARIIKSFVET